MDNLSLEMLDTMEVDEIAQLDAATLDALFWKANDEMVAAKRHDHRLHQVFEKRYSAQASEALLADERDTGTVYLRDGSFEVKVTRPKRVKWDQTKLREALDQIDPATAQHIASLVFKIDERKFEALMPDTQALLRPARTVETGKASYALNQKVAA